MPVLFGIAAVPAMFVPTRLFRTTLPAPDPIRTPSDVLPLMTLPIAAVPMTLLPESTRMPSMPFAIAAVPAAFVPM